MSNGYIDNQTTTGQLMDGTPEPTEALTITDSEVRRDLRAAGFMISTQRSDGSTQGPWNRAEAQWSKAKNPLPYVMMIEVTDYSSNWYTRNIPDRVLIKYGGNDFHPDCPLNQYGNPQATDEQTLAAGYQICLILERYNIPYKWNYSGSCAIVLTEAN
jgi:hypothetical protein